jgi:hypothetical protein
MPYIGRVVLSCRAGLDMFSRQASSRGALLRQSTDLQPRLQGESINSSMRFLRTAGPARGHICRWRHRVPLLFFLALRLCSHGG